MKRVAFVVILFLMFLFAVPSPAHAACIVGTGKAVTTNVSFTGSQFGSSMTVSGKTFSRDAAQCTTPVPSGPYTVSCDEETETLAVDSVFQPLCGASQELEKANSSCWTCGGDLRCAGLDFGLKSSDTSPELFNKVAISPTDTIEDMDRVWRVNIGENFPETFRFNGIEYNRNGRGIVLCRSNVLGCGASDLPPEQQCKSALFPNEDITDERTDDPNAGKNTGDIDQISINRSSGDPATRINSEPGWTAINMDFSTRKPLGDLRAAILTYMGFPVNDKGELVTTFPEWRRGGETMLGLFEGTRKIPGDIGGGKLLPLSLQKRLAWPQFNDEGGNDLTQAFADRRCAQFMKLAYDRKGKVNPVIAVTERFKNNFYFNWVGTHLLGAILGTTYTDGQPGVPSLNFKSAKQDIGEYDDVNKFFKLKLQHRDLLFLCGSQTASRPVNPLLLRIFGFTGEEGGLQAGEGQAFVVTANADSPGLNIIEVLVDAINNIFQKFVPLKFEKTTTVKTDLALASWGGLVGWTPKDDIPTRTSKEDFLGYKGVSRVFFSQFHLDRGLVGTYDQEHGQTQVDVNVGHAASPMSSAQTKMKVPQPGTKGEKRVEELTYGCVITPLAIQEQNGRDCNPTDDRLSRQHGSLDVPTDISSAVAPTWPEQFSEGILGQEFLSRYAATLITTQLSQEQRALLMTKIQGLINTYVTSGAWPNSQLGNTQFQDQIRTFSQDNGLNEAFLYALWIEETHASSVGDYPFGCGGYRDFMSSLDCIADDPTVQTYIRDDLYDALCMYADGQRGCTFEAHPNFVRNLMYYYDTLTTP